MKFVSVQAVAFKAVFEVLKDILNDVNIYFKKDGIQIITLDTARSALVDMFLHAENFEEYVCDDEVIAGVNIANTFKLLKTITNNDVITMEIKSKEFINISIKNEAKKTVTNFQLKLLDINEDQIELPEIDISVVTTMPSIDFQRMCRDMNNVASDVSICRSGKTFTVRCEGDFANQETIIECTDDTCQTESLLKGTYSLKYLNIFTKATGMCSTVQILQEEENRFLVLKYNVANLGELKFYLATKTDDI
jgi:proliferating cell nuclear antigen